MNCEYVTILCGVIPGSQERGCSEAPVFIQILATPLIRKQVKTLISLHFGDDHVISKVSQMLDSFILWI